MTTLNASSPIPATMSARNEFAAHPMRGWPVFGIFLVASLATPTTLIWLLIRLDGQGHASTLEVLTAIGLGLLCCLIGFLWFGFFWLQPNEAAVLTLFGRYKGSVRREGFYWANPLIYDKHVSLRVRNMQTEKIKVNDQRGNPIEIAAVVVWRVENTYQAVFDVDDYQHFVEVQSESAVRHLASAYPYDTMGENEVTLRGNIDDVSAALQTELAARLRVAGVIVDEARLTHLAYAPEIASAMLRRQQADAVVAARFRIVEGAVGMVEAALERLEQHKTIELDPERKAAMVSNLMVVLCGDQNVHPVVNTGTLYT